jgi:hypothetical protein
MTTEEQLKMNKIRSDGSHGMSCSRRLPRGCRSDVTSIFYAIASATIAGYEIFSLIIQSAVFLPQLHPEFKYFFHFTRLLLSLSSAECVEPYGEEEGWVSGDDRKSGTFATNHASH